MYFPHTWSGEANVEEYYKTLNKDDKNTQEIKKEFYISDIIAGMDAQVEVKPHQEPFVGGGTRMSRGNGATYCEMERRSTTSRLQTRSVTDGNPQEQKQIVSISGRLLIQIYSSGRSLTTLRSHSNGKQGAQRQETAGLRI